MSISRAAGGLVEAIWRVGKPVLVFLISARDTDTATRELMIDKGRAHEGGSAQTPANAAHCVREYATFAVGA